MSGSKAVLLVAILLMALAPWGIIYYAANTSEGASLFTRDEADLSQIKEKIRQEESLRYGTLIERLEEQVKLLEEKSGRLESELSILEQNDDGLAQLRTELRQEQTERIRALEKVAELRRQYDEALSTIVQLSSQVGMEREKRAAVAEEIATVSPKPVVETVVPPAPPPVEPTPPLEIPEPQPTPPSPPDTGGWILPPTN